MWSNLTVPTWSAMESGLSKICLFVRNLPYSLSDAELEAVFKVHGPLKSSYTVKQRGGGECS